MPTKTASRVSAAPRRRRPLAGIDVFRHVLILGVLWQHAMRADAYSNALNAQIATVSNFVDGAVIGFFIVSGYFFKCRSERSSYQDWRHYLAKQAKRLLLPFFFFSLAYTVVLAALGKSTLYVGLIRTVSFTGQGMQLYFLPYLFITAMLFCTVQALADGAGAKDHGGFGRKGLVGAAVFVLAGAASFIWPTSASTGPLPGLLALYVLAFAAGRLYNVYQNAGTAGRYASVLLAVALCVGFFDSRYWDFGTAFFLFVLFLQISVFLPDMRLPGSGGVYLLHTPVANFAISSILIVVGVVGWSNVAVTLLLTYAVCLAFTFAFVKLIPEYRWILLE